MLQEIINLIADELSLDAATITGQTNLIEDFKADSLEIVEIVIAIEEKYGIVVNEDDILTIQTVDDIVNYLSNHLK